MPADAITKQNGVTIIVITAAVIAGVASRAVTFAVVPQLTPPAVDSRVDTR